MDIMSLKIDSNLKLQMPDADIPERQSKTGGVCFAELFSQGNTLSTDNFTVDASNEIGAITKTDRTDASQQSAVDAYEKYQYQDKTIRTEAKPAAAEQDTQKAEEEISEFTEDVVETIAEELEVSKEAVAAAMEMLGFTAFDLSDARNLADLAVVLGGSEDAGALLCNETFTNLLQEIKELSNALCEELQLTPEETELLIQELQQSKEAAGLPLQEVNGEEAEIPEVTEDSDMTETFPKIEISEETEAVTEEKKFTVQQEQLNQDMADGEEKNNGNSEESAETLVHAKMTKEQQTVSVHPTGTVSFENQLGAVETVQSLPSYVSVSDIMEQFVTQASVRLSEETTKMEMQLNPEHLGKLYVEVTEHEGAITAKIQTQNALVKEALEMQIADLKQSLNQAGVKVDAVEVTVSSHEFERNLEQDANGQKQQENSGQKSARVRSINLNDLEGLSGLMTEEETIVAKMMAEQGNSVDFTA